MSYQPNDLTEEEEISIHEALENNNYSPANALGIEIVVEEELENGIRIVNISYNSLKNK